MPEPDTPVTQINNPRGKLTSIFFKLCPAAPNTVKHFSFGMRRASGTGTYFRPLKYCPVIETGLPVISSIFPWATTSPPFSPAPGPMSTIQSAVRIVSSSCSTTITVLPRSLKCSSVSKRRRLSRWCRPILGSSRMYRTPVRPLPI